MENVDDVTNLRQSSATFIANKGDFDVALALNAPHVVIARVIAGDDLKVSRNVVDNADLDLVTLGSFYLHGLTGWDAIDLTLSQTL